MTWILPKQLHTLACALDTEALSLDCTEQSQICAQSLFVRSKPLPLRTWSAKWKRDSWTQYLSGRILRPSLGQRFATEWTSSLVATPASPSVQPGSAEAKTTQGTCGPTSQTAFDFSDPGAASLRTSKDISAWGCPTSLKTWQEWVTERRGAYSARLNAARHTSGSGCSSWPTMTANEAKNSQGKSQLNRTPPSGRLYYWPTVQASEARQGFQDRSRGMKGSQESLSTVVVKHGPAAPASSSTDGSRPGWLQIPKLGGGIVDDTKNANDKRREPTMGGTGGNLGGQNQMDPSTLKHRGADGSNRGDQECQTQPALGGDADGSASGLDYAELCITCDNRTDELRLLGNGVVPTTAERAFLTLMRELDTSKSGS